MHRLSVILPDGVYLMAFDMRLLTTVVITSESKYISSMPSCISTKILIFGLWLRSWNLMPISRIRCPKLARATLNFRFCVSVFLNSKMSLMRLSRRSALVWMLSIFFVTKSGSRLSSIKSSRGPKMRVRGVRSSCVILVKKRSLSSFTSCFC